MPRNLEGLAHRDNRQRLSHVTTDCLDGAVGISQAVGLVGERFRPVDIPVVRITRRGYGLEIG